MRLVAWAMDVAGTPWSFFEITFTLWPSIPPEALTPPAHANKQARWYDHRARSERPTAAADEANI
jgi:hypothetical protein